MPPLFLSLAAAHLGEKHLLQLLKALEAGREPCLQHRFWVERLQIGAHLLFKLGHQAILHRLHLRQAEKAAQLIGRAIDVEFEFHRNASYIISTIANLWSSPEMAV